MNILKKPLRKAKRSLIQSLVRKAKQPKFNNPFHKHKFRQDFLESKIQKIYQYISFRKYLLIHSGDRSKYIFNYKKYSKGPLSQRERRFFIGSRKEIHYRNIDSIRRFIGLGGRIIPRRVTKLTLRHQRLMTNAIKKARFIALLPFISNELHFEKRWRDILDRRRKRKEERKNRKKRRSIPRVPKGGTGTQEMSPKREPRVPIDPRNRPWTRPKGGTGTQETSPKREPIVPKGGTGTQETSPKREPRVPIDPRNRPWTRPKGGTGTQETSPKREPRVPKGGTGTQETSPKREPRVPIDPRNRPWTRKGAESSD